MDRSWNCQEFEAGLSEYREGTLTPEAAAAARRHLAHCEACGELLASVGEAMTCLSELPELEPPPGLMAKIFAATAQPRAARPAAFWRPAWRRLSSPRLVMGLAMSVFAFSLLLNAAQIDLRHVSLAPGRVSAEIERTLDRSWARGVDYYHDLRVVYEIQAALHQMRQTPAPPPADGRDHSQRNAPATALTGRLAQLPPVSEPVSRPVSREEAL